MLFTQLYCRKSISFLIIRIYIWLMWFPAIAIFVAPLCLFLSRFAAQLSHHLPFSALRPAHALRRWTSSLVPVSNYFVFPKWDYINRYKRPLLVMAQYRSIIYQPVIHSKLAHLTCSWEWGGGELVVTWQDNRCVTWTLTDINCCLADYFSTRLTEEWWLMDESLRPRIVNVYS